MRNFITVLYSFFFSLVAFSQSSAPLEVKYALESIKSISSNSGMWIPGKSLDNTIYGTQYLFKNWNGIFKVTSSKDQKFQLFNLNYNLKTQKLESFIDKDSVFQYDLEQFKTIEHANKTYTIINNDLLNGLVQEICIGSKASLFKQITLQVQYGTLNPLTQEKISEDAYVQYPLYYLKINSDYMAIKPSKRTILSFLNDKKDEIKTFVKQNDLNYNSDENLKRILSYYNSL